MGKKRVIVLCGVSGSGKTWTRTHDLRFKDLPYVDVAEIYRGYYDGDVIADWETVVDDAIDQVKDLLEAHQRVVLEGYFLPNTGSRRAVYSSLQRDESQVDFLDLNVPLDLCIERIEMQWVRGEIEEEDAMKRIEMAKRCLLDSRGDTDDI